MTTIRNDVAHRRLDPEDRARVGGVLEHVVFGLLQRNRRFPERLLRVDQVRVTASGETEIVARSLNGSAAGSYRRGSWLAVRAPAQPRPGTVCLKLGEDELIDTGPFLVADEARVYVLDQVVRGRPVLRHFDSRAVLERSLSAEWAARWPSPDTVLDASPPPLDRPRPSAVAHAAPSISDALPRLPTSTPRAWIAAGGVVLAGAALACIGGVVSLALSGRGEPWDDASLPAAKEPTRGAASPRGATQALSGDTLPRLFSGAPLAWGSRVTELETVRGAVPTFAPFPECARTLVDIRESTWPAELELPERVRTTLAFHGELGLFEVMTYSNAEFTTLAATVAARLGPPHRRDHRRSVWEYPADSDLVRVAVSRPRVLGRSSVRVYRVAVCEAYGAARRAACATP